MPDTLVVNEIYLSVQGESTHAGLPCVFIRLTGCDLRCSYCDTAYAFRQGRKWPLDQIVSEVNRLGTPYSSTPPGPRLPLVELTGGEPLLQPATPTLLSTLCDAGYTVLLETSGAHDIRSVDPRVHRIVDIKCPSSGEMERNRWENLDHLHPHDEIKFVIGTREDYSWTKEILLRHRLNTKCGVLLSWVAPLTSAQLDPSLKPIPGTPHPITRAELVEQIVQDALPVRFQIQMHKIIWPADRKGV